MSDNAPSVRDRLLRSMVSSAFFSPQSALILGLSIIFFAFNVAPFEWWEPFFWLIFGALGEAAYVGATISDPRAQDRVISQMLTDRYNPNHIKNPGAQERMKKALEYYSAIQTLMTTRSGASKMEFQHTLDELDDWIEYLYELGKRVDRFDENQIINRDRMDARRELEALKRRIKAEPDERVKEEVQRAIQLKETQLENLKNLEANVKRADIQMDNTLSALGTVYAQLQLIGSKAMDSGSAKRLRNEVHDQVMGLQDTIAAIDEVQSAHAT